MIQTFKKKGDDYFLKRGIYVFSRDPKMFLNLAHTFKKLYYSLTRSGYLCSYKKR